MAARLIGLSGAPQDVGKRPLAAPDSGVVTELLVDRPCGVDVTLRAGDGLRVLQIHDRVRERHSVLGFGQPRPIAQRGPSLDLGAVVLPRTIGVRAPIRQAGGRREGVGARVGVRRRIRQRQRRLRSLQSLDDVPAALPEAPEVVAEAQRSLGVVLQRPGDCGAQVVVVELQPIERCAGAGPHRSGSRLACNGGERAGVALAKRVPSAALLRLLDRELADRLEHREARLAPGALLLAGEALLDQ